MEALLYVAALALHTHPYPFCQVSWRAFLLVLPLTTRNSWWSYSKAGGLIQKLLLASPVFPMRCAVRFGRPLVRGLFAGRQLHAVTLKFPSLAAPLNAPCLLHSLTFFFVCLSTVVARISTRTTHFLDFTMQPMLHVKL